MGLFDKSRTKQREQENTEEVASGQSSGSQEVEKGTASTAYKCASCGRMLTGPALYCDGCGQYYCYTCGIASGDMIWNCPNCAIEAQRVNL